MSKRIYIHKVKMTLMPLIATLLLLSCGPKLTVYKIQEIPEDYSAQEVVNDYYDEEAKLGYTVLRDNDHLYLNISTRESASQLKMLRNGVVVFLDKEGKKDETVFLQYPLTPGSKASGNPKTSREGKATFLNKKIEGLQDDILFVNGENEEYINRLLNNEGISAEINAVEDELYYQIKFPISYVAATGQKLPTVGIAIKGLETRASQPMQPAQSMRSGGKGSGGRGMGGGRGGGRGGGKRGGSTSGTPAPQTRSTNQTQDMGSNVAIWFKVDLDQ